MVLNTHWCLLKEFEDCFGVVTKHISSLGFQTSSGNSTLPFRASLLAPGKKTVLELSSTRPWLENELSEQGSLGGEKHRSSGDPVGA